MRSNGGMIDPVDALLLTPDEMAAVDLAAAQSGLSSYGLMERAGQAVAAAALRLYPGALRFVILCGPGNNGGDGYVATRALKEAGAGVALFALGNPAGLKGDAAMAHALSPIPPLSVDLWEPAPGDVIIDAIFGAGLGRDVPAEMVRLVEAAAAHAIPVIAVDLPSGLDGRTGQIRGAAFQAVHTVTFMARKPGHLLMPGRKLCGTVEVFDIGIPKRVLRAHAGPIAENRRSDLPRLAPAEDGHKFRRGHLVVFSGGRTATGAARLSAAAGLRAGAGLVTLAVPPDAVDVVAAQVTAVMVKPIAGSAALEAWSTDRRLSAFVIGPGFGVGENLRAYVEHLAGRPMVLDADGITAFAEDPLRLFDHYKEKDEPTLVLTPHEGEFARLFPDLASDHTLSKVDRAMAAAKRAGGVIVYKGADTVISDGRHAAINSDAPPWLATAGSGDVLAGIIGALLAQGLNAYAAARLGVLLHAEAGKRAGPGLDAERLAGAVPADC